MDTQGILLPKILVLIGTLLLSTASSALDLDNADIEKYCIADQDYVERPASSVGAASESSFDFSCLTDFHSLSDELTKYQLIDTRIGSDSSERIAGAWHLSVQQLRSLPNLTDRHLLLLGDDFSRAEAAKSCALLAKAGFANVKFLLGGARAWRAHHQPRYLNVRDATPSVSAHQFIYEYFNSRVILAFASQDIGEALNELGFSQNQHLIGPDTSLAEIVADRSAGGQYPVVFVGDHKHDVDLTTGRFTNLYTLTGGIHGLEKELLKSRWINARRGQVHGGSHCG